MKKALKNIGITLLVTFVLLIAIPFAFQGQIKDLVKRFINENVNAKVEYSAISLSFIRSFPQAHVAVNNLRITNLEPFKDETLATAKNIAFTMSIKELFKKADNEPLVINSITIDEALLSLKTDKFGNTNYAITKEKSNMSSESKTSNFSFSLQDYKINKSACSYLDEASNMVLYITELNHEGYGIFSADHSELDTKSEANISVSIDSTSYLTNNPIKLDALIGLDLFNSKYTFKENKGFINNLPIQFQGYVQLLENGQEVNIAFENPESDFKNFLAIVPKVYAKNMEDLETTGDFKVKGLIKGLMTDETIPTLDIRITSNNTSFKYPNLPKGVNNITINTEIKNTTGHSDDTYIDIKTLNFKIDDDVFKSAITLKNITKNMVVNANIDGVLNLENITKAYPVEIDNAQSGILKAKLNCAFDMNAIKTNAYERIKNKGSASITNFVFSSENTANPIHIDEASITFNPESVSLNHFTAKTGNSDLYATGSIKNLYGFLLNNSTLKGHFDLNSNVFKVSDFMTDSDVKFGDHKTSSDTESLKIPAFLECTITAHANTVVYDNLNLKNVKGTLYIKDQQVALENITSSIFDGTLLVSGEVSTKNDIPTFNLNLNAIDFDVAKSFKDLDLFQSLAPIAKLIQGKLNTGMHLAGELNKEFSPNLNTVSGNASAELLTPKINTDQGGLFSKLEGALSFIDFDKLDLKALKTNLSFTNGKVSVKPFDLKYQDIGITVSGNHNFDKTLEYEAVFNVPAKYLSREVNQLIAKINSEEAKNITIPITANIGGAITNPNVTTDLTSSISNLTKQLIEIEKQKLLNQGKDKVNSMLVNLLGNNKTKTDSIKKEQRNSAKNVLEVIVGGNKTKTDTTKIDTRNETVKNVLGGLLKKKKKVKDTTKQNE